MPPKPEAKNVNVDSLPQDVVIVTLWTGEDPNPVQATISLTSWDAFARLVRKDGIDPKATYIFENNVSPGGRKVLFFITSLTKVSANYYTGIISAKSARWTKRKKC